MHKNEPDYRLHAPLTGERFDADIQVRYTPESLPDRVSPAVQEFHNLLVELTEIAQGIPQGLIQRYGTNPFKLYKEGTPNLQTAMTAAFRNDRNFRMMMKGFADTQES